MADLSIINTTLTLMDEALVKEKSKEPPRTYLGMSEIGDICTRKLWLNYHHERPTSGISAKGYRIFDTGDMIEARIVRNLRRAGVKVDRTKRKNSYFFTVENKLKNHVGAFAGHSDGRLKGLPESSQEHILEVKSANDKNFKIFQKEGIAGHKQYGDKYIFQIQCYLKYSGLKRCLFIVENKNTSERYMERINYDVNIACKAEAKAIAIIEAKTPPSPIGDESWYECKFCPHNNDTSCRREWNEGGGW